MINRKFGRKTGMIVGGSAAVVALTLAGALPAEAATYVGSVTTNNFSVITEFSGHLSGYYARFSIHNDKGYDYAASTVHIRHTSSTASTTYYGGYAAPGSWSYDNLDYANVIRIGDSAYV